MAVETKRYSQDGISSVYIRELVAGVGTGSWKKVGGVNSASVTREVTDRELLGDNVVYRATSKFKQYTGTLGFFGQSWDMLEFFLPGSLATVDGHASSALPVATQFALAPPTEDDHP